MSRSDAATSAKAPSSVLDAPSALAKLERQGIKRGAAAVAILACGEGEFLWQRKTPGYPVPSQVGGLCLFGGNKESDDAKARATLERELLEELGPDVVATLTPFTRFVIDASAEVMAPKPAYCFTVCVFYASLPQAPKRTEEGVLEVHTPASLSAEKFCWGYHHVFNAWTTEADAAIFRGQAAQPHEAGAATFAPLPACAVLRIAADAEVGAWASGEVWR